MVAGGGDRMSHVVGSWQVLHVRMWSVSKVFSVENRQLQLRGVCLPWDGLHDRP